MEGGWGGWCGRVSGVGGWAARRGLKPSLGPFGLAISPRSSSHSSKHAQKPKRCLTTTGVNFRPMPSM